MGKQIISNGMRNMLLKFENYVGDELAKTTKEVYEQVR